MSRPSFATQRDCKRCLERLAAEDYLNLHALQSNLCHSPLIASPLTLHEVEIMQPTWLARVTPALARGPHQCKGG
jgi:hypothetical protein